MAKVETEGSVCRAGVARHLWLITRPVVHLPGVEIDLPGKAIGSSGKRRNGSLDG